MVKAGRFSGAAFFPAAVMLGTAALYQGLVIRTYRLTTPKWRRGREVRFAVVADLHSQFFGPGQREILRLIRAQRPDYILLPGDILDERVHPRGARDFLRGAAELAPTYYAPGNHEYRTRNMPAVLRMIRRCGVHVLADSLERLETPAGPLLLAGCEDIEKSRAQDPGYDQAASLAGAFAGIGQSDAYTVLLAHRPERAELYRLLGFDLTVSGHAHGGQARIPFLLNGLYATGQGLFPAYTGGCYRHGGSALVVSRGLAGFPRFPRIFNPPEIVVVRVAGGSGEPSRDE